MTMADNGPDNLVLRYLREIDRKLDGFKLATNTGDTCSQEPKP
jgi:hypothetical protein